MTVEMIAFLAALVALTVGMTAYAEVARKQRDEARALLALWADTARTEARAHRQLLAELETERLQHHGNKWDAECVPVAPFKIMR